MKEKNKNLNLNNNISNYTICDKCKSINVGHYLGYNFVEYKCFDCKNIWKIYDEKNSEKII